MEVGDYIMRKNLFNTFKDEPRKLLLTLPHMVILDVEKEGYCYCDVIGTEAGKKGCRRRIIPIEFDDYVKIH